MSTSLLASRVGILTVGPPVPRYTLLSRPFKRCCTLSSLAGHQRAFPPRPPPPPPQTNQNIQPPKGLPAMATPRNPFKVAHRQDGPNRGIITPIPLGNPGRLSSPVLEQTRHGTNETAWTDRLETREASRAAAATGSLPLARCRWLAAAGSLPLSPCHWLAATGSLPLAVHRNGSSCSDVRQ